ncbi:MAG: aldo/keto reductase [Deltaproteobacteria bacterium]|nr:aldo/keto reductase [Deltaproteobacteria bacterium]
MSDPTRRTVIESALGVAATSVSASAPLRTDVAPHSNSAGIPLRTLGKTGVRVSSLGLGGWHVGALPKPEAIKLMHAAIDEGVTFFDNAWDYHEGGAESIMGDALAVDGKRQQVFLMSKNCERDYEGSMRCLDESLRRLRTDHLDLWQFHEINYDNDPRWLLERGGLRAALEAKKAGKVRFIGFTGHKHPDLHLATLQLKFPWDTVQMPINIMDAQYRSFEKNVVPVAKRQGVGIIGMKSLGGGAPTGTFLARNRSGLSAEQCIRYSLTVDISTLVMGIMSLAQLKQNAAVARAFSPMPAQERQQLLKLLHDEATDGRFELFKSTNLFDGPHHRKQHGHPV